MTKDDNATMRDTAAPVRFLACLKCGRALKALESQQRGYGPVCWERARLVRALYAQTTVPQQRRLEEKT